MDFVELAEHLKQLVAMDNYLLENNKFIVFRLLYKKECLIFIMGYFLINSTKDI